VNTHFHSAAGESLNRNCFHGCLSILYITFQSGAIRRLEIDFIPRSRKRSGLPSWPPWRNAFLLAVEGDAPGLKVKVDGRRRLNLCSLRTEGEQEKFSVGSEQAIASSGEGGSLTRPSQSPRHCGITFSSLLAA
jgi:hypothetical protein